MSVFAFVQSSSNDGTVLLVKDNELKNTSEEFFEYMPQIKSFFQLVHNKERPTYIKNGNQHIFVGFHKQRDVANRRREFLLSWNSNDSKNMVVETAKKIDITDEFDYDKLEKEKAYTNVFLYIVIVAVVIILYKLFQE